jgi:hypothetical protein
MAQSVMSKRSLWCRDASADKNTAESVTPEDLARAVAALNENYLAVFHCKEVRPLAEIWDANRIARWLNRECLSLNRMLIEMDTTVRRKAAAVYLIIQQHGAGTPGPGLDPARFAGAAAARRLGSLAGCGKTRI